MRALSACTRGVAKAGTTLAPPLVAVLLSAVVGALDPVTLGVSEEVSVVVDVVAVVEVEVDVSSSSQYTRAQPPGLTTAGAVGSTLSIV